MALETDIEALRERVSDTQELYREVCALMFFRYDETPTANKLYQLVRKGSMSAPAKALRDFWTSVREKTRIDVGQPDLPPEVAAAAGDLVARLWQHASEHAQLGLQSFQQDAQHEADDARRNLEEANRERDAALAAARKAADSVSVEKQRMTDMEASLMREQAANTMLRDEVERTRSEAVAAGGALADARKDFAGELEKLRISLAQNEQRLVAAEKRALMEIENERSASGKARKDLVAANEHRAVAETAHRAERDRLRDELATLKAQLVASQKQTDRSQHVLDTKQTELANKEATIDALKLELRVAAERNLPRLKIPASSESVRRRHSALRKTRGRVGFSVGPRTGQSNESS